MKNLLYFLVTLLAWVSCTIKEETVSFDSSLGLVFSSDTVSFDTLLSDTQSSTKRLKVVNPNNEAIIFSEIKLGKSVSDYNVVINGQETRTLTDQKLLGGDSLLILVEVSVEPQNQDLPYLVKDSIIFNWNTNTTHVKLVTYAQDGNRVSNAVLCDELWTSDRPYIVSDAILVDSLCDLTIEKGTTIYMENDAAIFVKGSLSALGDSSAHITFKNARFDSGYDEVPGQWDGIYFLEGSKDNHLAFVDILNGQVGLRVGTPDDDSEPDLVVEHASIYNMSLAGILAFTSDVTVVNSQIYNCGTYLVGNFLGGNYSYQHCTLSSWPSNFILEEAGVQFSDNIVSSDDEVFIADLTVEIVNSIVWGSQDEELLVSDGGGANVSLDFRSNVIRSVSGWPENYVSTELNFPGFLAPALFDYSLDTLAFSIDKGVDIGVSFDILGVTRDSSPDIGAFERVEGE